MSDEKRLSTLNKTAQVAQVGFIVVAALFVYAFVATAKDGEARRSCTALCAMKPNYAAIEKRAPDFELPNLEGKPVKLSDYRGQVVILNFWSKTCPPCLEEMPSLAQLAHAVAQDPNITVLTITTDESAEDAKTTLQSILGTKAPFEVLVDSEQEVVADKFGTKLYPETWFIDPQGVIRARVDGARDWSQPLAVELAESLVRGRSCQIEFKRGKAKGPQASICTEMGY